MLRRRFLVSAVLVAVIAIPTAAAARSESRDDHSSADVQSGKNFQAQIAAIIQAYRKHDAAKGHQLIEQFRLPNPEAWFSEHLNPARSAEFTERYERAYTNFAEALENTVEEIVETHGAELAAELEPGSGETPEGDLTPSIRRSGVVATKPVELFFCSFRTTIKKELTSAWGQTFTREDGAFRFLGFGHFPFWVWQRGTELAAPKNGYFVPPPVFISRTDPVYPVQARAEKVQGVVLLHVRVDAEGRVEKAEVVSGDPRLAQAALNAVQEWRYKPVMRGGVPIEVERSAKVVFALH
jgi:TonB family protein